MDFERKKIYDLIEKVKVIMDNHQPKGSKGYTETEIKELVEKYIPNYKKEVYEKYLEDVDFIQVGKHRIAFTHDVQSLLYNMFYHHS